ncbi:MAG: hypothetical protein QOI21_5837 [Actinomycetota bacterium]|jgi:hypothetical protein|nr:hypothetical protein [Actinomycetota bacterium]
MSRRVLAVLVAVLTMLGVVASPSLASPPPSVPEPFFAPVQTLTWTADNSTTQYRSAPTTAVPGETTIVFENSAATGNTSGMTHTLTFDTSSPGYNHDVSLNILAGPFDAENGRHEATVTLTPGKYRYFCSIPGHSTMTGEFTVTAGGADTTAPTVSAAVTGAQDPTGGYVGSATVALTATDVESGVDSVEYKLDSSAWTAYTAPVVVSSVGAHMVHYRATDSAGNVSVEGMSSFTVVEAQGDTTPPTVTATVTGTQDGDGNYVDAATATLTSADTGSGVDKAEYKLDDAAWSVYSAPVVVNTPGMHMLHYRATDKAGNVSPEGMAHFTVVQQDTTVPTVTAAVTGERDADGNYIDSAQVAVTATDAGSGVSTVEYKLDAGAWTAYTAPVPVTAAGPHTVLYRATDKAGNASAEGTVSFTLVKSSGDVVPPTTSVRLTGTQNGDWAYVGSVTVTVSAADTESGVAGIEYKMDSGAWAPYSAPIVVSSVGAHTVSYRATDVAGNVAAALSGSFTVVAAGPPPGQDVCPRSDTRDTVMIGTVDSQVANVDTGNGCTINDVIDDDAEYASNEEFVGYVEAVTAELVESGVLTDSDRDRIITAAIESGIGGFPAEADAQKTPKDRSDKPEKKADSDVQVLSMKARSVPDHAAPITPAVSPSSDSTIGRLPVASGSERR